MEQSTKPPGSSSRHYSLTSGRFWRRALAVGAVSLGWGTGAWAVGVLAAGPAAAVQPRDVAAVQSGFAGDLVTRANDERNARGLASLNTNSQFMADAATMAASYAATGTPGAVNTNCPGPSIPPTGTSCEMAFSWAASGNNATDGSDGVDSLFMSDVGYRHSMLAPGNADIGIGVSCSNNQAYITEIFGFSQGTDQTLGGFITANQAESPSPSDVPVVAGSGVGNPWFCPGEQVGNTGPTATGGQITVPGNSALPTPSPPPTNFVNPPPPPVIISTTGLPGPVTGMASTPSGSGYWLVNAQGAVSPHGTAASFGSMAGRHLNAPISHIVSTPDGAGYWLVASDGGTFAFGDAGFFGSMGGQRLNAPVVDIAPTFDGAGYWLVATDGGVFAFGDARFFGSMGGQRLNAPVVGMAPDDASGGYWLVATDGGVFAFQAPFYGSAGALRLNSPVIGMATTFDSGGYWLNAGDGGVFTYGDAKFFGSTGASKLSAPIVDLAPDSATGGYWQVDRNGIVYAYQAPFYGNN